MTHAEKLGSTDEGERWAWKALHPADARPAGRCPTGSTLPTVLHTYDRLMRFTAPAAAINSWTFGGTVMPHLVSPLMCYTDASNGRTWTQTVLNWTDSSIDTLDSFIAQNAYLNSAIEGARLAYLGITLYLDAPSLADQGTIAASQSVTTPQIMPLTYGDGNTSGAVEVITFQNADIPTFNTILQVPNSYTNRAKEGLYMPYHMTEFHFTPVGKRQMLSAVSGAGNSPVGSIQTTLTQDATGIWPLPLARAFGSPSGATSFVPFLEGNFGNFILTNLSTQASVTIRLRVGYELQVNFNSPLYPYARIAPRRDEDALYKYREVSQLLQLAYPADYNDLDLLKRRIKGALNTVISKGLPLVGGLLKTVHPGLGALAETGVSLLRKAGRPRAGKGGGRKPKSSNKKGKGAKAEAVAPTSA